MIDEGTLRERFPEIPWDQPVKVEVTTAMNFQRWVCRYCIALNGLRGFDPLSHLVPYAFEERKDALFHIETEHHD